MISIPAFGEACCRENRENKNSHVFNIPGVDESMFDAYCVFIEKMFRIMFLLRYVLCVIHQL